MLLVLRCGDSLAISETPKAEELSGIITNLDYTESAAECTFQISQLNCLAAYLRFEEIERVNDQFSSWEINRVKYLILPSPFQERFASKTLSIKYKPGKDPATNSVPASKFIQKFTGEFFS